MQEQNALIGVALAGYYPDISLSGLLEWTGTHPLPFTAAHEIWSLGAAGAQTLFNGGLTGAQVDAARALYWESVANYRQTVLTAFQGVEDQLAAIRILTQQLKVQREAVFDARRGIAVYEKQLNEGHVDATALAVWLEALVSDEEAELTIRQNLYVASVTLIEDLGGGWDSNLLPKQKDLVKDISLLPQL
jgi:outer membrane protein TolC